MRALVSREGSRAYHIVDLLNWNRMHSKKKNEITIIRMENLNFFAEFNFKVGKMRD